MARKTIRIELPTGSPDDMVILAEDILAHHTELGSAAELDPARVAEMAAKAAAAKDKRKRAADFAAKAETLNLEAATLLGLAPGQDSQTEGTVLFQVSLFRDTLLPLHRGSEQALGEYGYDITLGTAKTPGPRTKKA